MDKEFPKEITVFIRKSGILDLNMPLTETILGGVKYIRSDLVIQRGTCSTCEEYASKECAGVHPYGFMSCTLYIKEKAPKVGANST